jgi:hypothetical protein
MRKEESSERGERDARQSRKGSGSDLGRVANESDLAVRTKSFALQIIRLFSTLPKTTEAQVIGKQVLRSGTSVGANYREAYRGRSKAEWSERAPSDMDGNAARVTESDSGEERINSSQNVETRCAN